ncbi:ECF transporter S component [Pectinatus frisingensis]|jgi:riboflavin transporter FmnP|uniref:ECF transporter S component n=1 Tax=Pectinatus frisingensis TaxID=865 RepID=UPI001E317786|nr:ECF transporter S component [Pectinatus frisingensis]
MENKIRIKVLTSMSMLIAISLVLVAAVNFPLIPAAPYLKYDPADIPILIGTFLFGTSAGIILTAFTALLQGILISTDGGPIGILMHFAATGSFVVMAGLLYNHTRTKRAAKVALICGTITMTVVMVVFNLLITPFFLGASIKQVIEMLLPIIIPFNLLKAGINSILVWIIYKPVSRFINKI